MSGRKNVLPPYQIFDDVAMSADRTSTPTNIQYLDNVGIQLQFTGTPVGTFNIQVSMDYERDAQGNIISAGTWLDMDLGAAIEAAGSADQFYIDLNQLSAPWIRVKYTRTSSTGTLNGWITAKQV